MTKEQIQTINKAVLRKNFIPVNTYILKDERSQINNLIVHLKKLGKEQILGKSLSGPGMYSDLETET